MQEPRLALVSTASLLGSRSISPRIQLDPPRSAVGPSLGVAGALVVASFLAGLPMLSMGLLAVGGVAAVVRGSLTRRRGPAVARVALDSIASREAREAYRRALSAFTDVQRAAAASARLRSSVAPALERGRAVIGLCGRMAQLANPLQHYLDLNDPMVIRAELDRLRARAEAASDDQAASAWSHATAARARQLAMYEQMCGMRDRVVARLELARAALEALAATIVRLTVLGEEQLVLSDASVIEHLDGVDAEIAALEAALAADFEV